VLVRNILKYLSPKHTVTPRTTRFTLICRTRSWTNKREDVTDNMNEKKITRRCVRTRLAQRRLCRQSVSVCISVCVCVCVCVCTFRWSVLIGISLYPTRPTHAVDRRREKKRTTLNDAVLIVKVTRTLLRRRCFIS
jgi:hypothetical protein